jgi:hypothetical protein
MDVKSRFPLRLGDQSKQVLSELRTRSENGWNVSPLFPKNDAYMFVFSPHFARFAKAFPTFCEHFLSCPEF